jgi:hypothetical protein
VQTGYNWLTIAVIGYITGLNRFFNENFQINNDIYNIITLYTYVLIYIYICKVGLRRSGTVYVRKA